LPSSGFLEKINSKFFLVEFKSINILDMLKLFS